MPLVAQRRHRMLTVGQHLRDTALERNGSDIDMFGRSAFNRYYYSAYLRTREMLKSVGSDFTMGHSAIPDHLRAKMKPLFRSRSRAASRLTGGSEVDANGSACHRLCGLIAERIEFLRSLRVTADYNPEVQATINGNEITLGSTTSAIAQKNVREIHQFCTELERLWRQIAA